ncbi:hypothetical protein ILUMI_18805 [Ignelater luminosus]|uniref:Uncharacterized protein n=1 Tax=Ignelater luminosus TaxID=2038154 RepID=A0A8K0CPD3_IGNLU|nr:hypothetical protein ILUMI_18805 [Ignelater luminosus]
MRKSGSNIKQLDFRREIASTILQRYGTSPKGASRSPTSPYSSISDEVRLDGLGHYVELCNRRRCGNPKSFGIWLYQPDKFTGDDFFLPSSHHLPVVTDVDQASSSSANPEEIISEENNLNTPNAEADACVPNLEDLSPLSKPRRNRNQSRKTQESQVLTATLNRDKLCNIVAKSLNHLLQSLDMRVYRSLKANWAKSFNDYMKANPIWAPNKSNFDQLFNPAFLASLPSISTVDEILKRPEPSVINTQKRVTDSSAKCLIPVKEIYSVRSTLPKNRGRSKNITPKILSSVSASFSAVPTSVNGKEDDWTLKMMMAVQATPTQL